MPLHPSQKDMKMLEVLYSKKNFNELEVAANKLIQKYPNIAPLMNILGFALHKQGNFKKAIISYEQAIAINPKFVFAHNNLGNVFKDLGEFNKALLKYQDAIKLNPKYAEAYYNQGLTYKKIFKYNESIKSFEHALKIKSDYIDAYFDLGQILITIGKFEAAIKNFQKVINLKPDFAPAYNNIFFTLLYMKKNDHNFFISLAKKFKSSLKIINPKLLLKYQFENKPKKLKIGFVSGDLWEHPVGYILLDVLKNLKKKELELVAYSNFPKKDDFSLKLKSHFTKWHEIHNKKDDEVINLIRNDKINILIDLSGHSAKNRLSVFMNKAAPVQISWGGYPGFTGISEIDYVIGDIHVTPKKDENFFSNKVFILPKIWICFTTPETQIEIKELPAVKNGYITFGSFNNLSKINEEVISLWSKILNAVPKSKIFLNNKTLKDIKMREMIIDNFKKNNVNSNSIILDSTSPRKKTLDSYNKIDIALDPFPYSGAITTFEAIWMGVPVLTKKGNQFVSRTTESINHNSGMSDWVAIDENEYLSKAIKFSSNINELKKIRKNLRKTTINLPSFNTLLFTEEFSKALWKIWENFILQNR